MKRGSIRRHLIAGLIVIAPITATAVVLWPQAPGARLQFSLADGLEKRLGPWLRKRVLTYDPSHKTPGTATHQPAE